VRPLLAPAICLCVTLAMLPAGGTAAAADVPENDLFSLNCLACHGAALEGVEGLGVSLRDSPFVARRSVDELVAFLKVGRMPGDPDAVSGQAMPGFGWLPEEELREIAAYVKSRHGP